MKTRVGLIYGGDSVEHDVSCLTAESISKNIDRELFDVKEFFIPKKTELNIKKLIEADVELAFLAVHGPNCEDGKLQALLEKHNIKYTGSGVEASALNMDKVRMHDAFAKAGLPIVKHLSFTKFDGDTEVIAKTESQIGYPCFVKPNNAGSSLGISKAKNIHELRQGILKAFKFDSHIIIEAAVDNPREIELGVLGNEELIISEPGEVLSDGVFYSYEKKYLNPFETTTKTDFDEKQVETLKKAASRAYKATGCSGYARIDFLISEEGQLFINEINTLPGFTKSSMYPKLMETVGIEYKELITKIIKLALK